MIDNDVPQFPHCDAAVLHAPGECTYCDKHPDWQSLRHFWGIAYTGHEPAEHEVPCPSDARRGTHGAHTWGGNRPTEIEVPVEPSYASRTLYSHSGDTFTAAAAAARRQPPPQPTDGPAIQDLVIDDIAIRTEVGRQRYGTALQAHNGRDALRDAYEEAMDLTIYLRQLIAERGELR